MAIQRLIIITTSPPPRAIIISGHPVYLHENNHRRVCSLHLQHVDANTFDNDESTRANCTILSTNIKLLAVDARRAKCFRMLTVKFAGTRVATKTGAHKRPGLLKRKLDEKARYLCGVSVARYRNEPWKNRDIHCCRHRYPVINSGTLIALAGQRHLDEMIYPKSFTRRVRNSHGSV